MTVTKKTRLRTPVPTLPVTSKDGLLKVTETAGKVLFEGSAADLTFNLAEGITAFDYDFAKAHSAVTKSHTDPSGGPELTLLGYYEETTMMVSVGPNDFKAGDKVFIHLVYAEGKKLVIPVELEA